MTDVYRPSAETLGALARKYRHLSALRRSQQAGEPTPSPTVFRSIAREFPGALRELDTLPLEEIDARASALESAVRSAEFVLPAWLAWLVDYHHWMRVALDIKRRAGRTRDVTAEIVQAADRCAGERVDREWITRVVAPPRGRVRPLVIEQVARMNGATPAAVEDAILRRRIVP